MKKYTTEFIQSLVTLNQTQLVIAVETFLFAVESQKSDYYIYDKFCVHCTYEAVPQIMSDDVHEYMYVVIQNGEEIRGFQYSFDICMFTAMEVQVKEAPEMSPEEMQAWENEAWNQQIIQEEQDKCTQQAVQSGHMGDYEWMIGE